IEIDAAAPVPVVATVRFGQIPVSVVQPPLAASGTGVVARCHRRIHAELSHESAARVTVVEVTTNAELLDLDLAGATAFGRPDQCVVLRMVERPDVRDICAELTGERLRVEDGRLLTAIAVEPGEVAERK